MGQTGIEKKKRIAGCQELPTATALSWPLHPGICCAKSLGAELGAQGSSMPCGSSSHPQGHILFGQGVPWEGKASPPGQLRHSPEMFPALQPRGSAPEQTQGWLCATVPLALCTGGIRNPPAACPLPCSIPAVQDLTPARRGMCTVLWHGDSDGTAPTAAVGCEPGNRDTGESLLRAGLSPAQGLRDVCGKGSVQEVRLALT